ncbi:MAG TPA: fluoride efflux transporter CrcB [Herpetosiphonaceae bacterium]
MPTPTLDRQAEDVAAPRLFELSRRHNLIIAAGAILGVLARFGAGEWSKAYSALDFPLGTLIINLVGCLLIGVVQTIFLELRLMRREIQLFLAVGLLGGFTTFSTFSVETMRLLQAGRVPAAITYLALSLVGGMAAVVAGVGATHLLTHWLRRKE